MKLNKIHYYSIYVTGMTFGCAFLGILLIPLFPKESAPLVALTCTAFPTLITTPVFVNYVNKKLKNGVNN